MLSPKYTPVPQDTWFIHPGPICEAGAGNRTPDLLITSEPLCHLSYAGLSKAESRAAAEVSSAVR